MGCTCSIALIVGIRESRYYVIPREYINPDWSIRLFPSVHRMLVARRIPRAIHRFPCPRSFPFPQRARYTHFDQTTIFMGDNIVK